MRQCLPVLLAGGVSSRLAPITTHKPFIPVFGRPLIFYTLDRLKAAGLNEAVVVINPNDQAHAKKLHYPGMDLTIVTQGSEPGMAGALLAAASKIANRSILVLNAVELIDPEFVIAFIKNCKSEISVVGRKVKTYFPGGYFQLNEDGKAIGISEKPGAGNEPSDLVNIVLHYLPNANDFLAILKSFSTATDDHYEQALSQMMAKSPVSVVPYTGYFLPVKFPWQVLDSVMFLLEHELSQESIPEVSIAPSAILEGKVYLEPGVKIGHHAIIKGPVYLGKNVVIGDGALVRQSCLEANTVIGYGSEIARSYLGPNSETHIVYVGDSLLEGDNWFAAGVKTANVRLDKTPVRVGVKGELIDTGRTKLGVIAGRGVKVGINASLMPGVCLAAKSIIKPGEVVYASSKK